MAETTPRAVRVPDDLWEAAIDKAQEDGTTVTAVVIKALERFVKRP
jgi:predicted HicB family RNase H-like nuclease